VTDGLEGIVAAATRLSHVDGEAGHLTLAGYAVEDLAPHASFEEVAYLFLHGRLPELAEHAAFVKDLAARRALQSMSYARLPPGRRRPWTLCAWVRRFSAWAVKRTRWTMP
jgi:citrate synthase